MEAFKINMEHAQAFPCIAIDNMPPDRSSFFSPSDAFIFFYAEEPPFRTNQSKDVTVERRPSWYSNQSKHGTTRVLLQAGRK